MHDLEGKIEQRAVDLIWKHLGIEGSKLNIRSDTGYPDRIFWIPGGRPLLIEFKRPGEEPEPKQIHIHNKLRQLGYNVEVHDDALEAFKSVVDHVRRSTLTKSQKKVVERALSIYYTHTLRKRK